MHGDKEALDVHDKRLGYFNKFALSSVGPLNIVSLLCLLAIYIAKLIKPIKLEAADRRSLEIWEDIQHCGKTLAVLF